MARLRAGYQLQLISWRQGGSAPGRVQVRPAQLAAKDSARRSSSAPMSFSCWPGDPSLLVQGEQQRGLKAVAGADGVDDLDLGRARLRSALPSRARRCAPLLPRVMTTRLAPCRQQRARALLIRLLAKEILEIDIRHLDEIGAGGKRAHARAIGRLVLDQIGPAVRIEGDRRRSLARPRSGACVSAAPWSLTSVVEPTWMASIVIERNGAAPVGPVPRRGLGIIEGVLRLAGDDAHEGERGLVVAARRVAQDRHSTQRRGRRSCGRTGRSRCRRRNPVGAPSRAMPTATLRQEPPTAGITASRPSAVLVGTKSISASPQLKSACRPSSILWRMSRIAARLLAIELAQQLVDLALACDEIRPCPGAVGSLMPAQRRHRGHGLADRAQRRRRRPRPASRRRAAPAPASAAAPR